MVFHVHDIVTPEQFTLIKAIGALGALLWVPKIDNLESYLVGPILQYFEISLILPVRQADLEILIGNVLDAFALIDPSKIIDKMKLQILPNLPDDIRRFGPAIRYATEGFECYNAIFRLCSVLSNHQAPSRDIANKFASMDRLKHILSGGYWKVEDEWVRAGPKVCSVLHDDTFLQRHLGWVPAHQPRCGWFNLFNVIVGRDADTIYAFYQVMSSHNPEERCHPVSGMRHKPPYNSQIQRRLAFKRQLRGGLESL